MESDKPEPPKKEELTKKLNALRNAYIVLKRPDKKYEYECKILDEVINEKTIQLANFVSIVVDTSIYDKTEEDKMSPEQRMLAAQFKEIQELRKENGNLLTKIAAQEKLLKNFED